jgi:hypothetical protein
MSSNRSKTIGRGKAIYEKALRVSHRSRLAPAAPPCSGARKRLVRNPGEERKRTGQKIEAGINLRITK